MRKDYRSTGNLCLVLAVCVMLAVLSPVFLISKNAEAESVEDVITSVEKVEDQNDKLRKDLKKKLSHIKPKKLEFLVRNLFMEIGFIYAYVVSPEGRWKDGGIDVRACKKLVGKEEICIAIQVKRWNSDKVDAGDVKNVCDSLNENDQVGLIVTNSTFTKIKKCDAKDKECCKYETIPLNDADKLDEELIRLKGEAKKDKNKKQILLIDGKQLIELLIEHEVGVTKTIKEVIEIDDSYFSEKDK